MANNSIGLPVHAAGGPCLPAVHAAGDPCSIGLPVHAAGGPCSIGLPVVPGRVVWPSTEQQRSGKAVKIA